MHPTFCSLQSGWNLVFWCLTFRVHPTFCSLIFRMHPVFNFIILRVHPWFAQTFRVLRALSTLYMDMYSDTRGVHVHPVHPGWIRPCRRRKAPSRRTEIRTELDPRLSLTVYTKCNEPVSKSTQLGPHMPAILARDVFSQPSCLSYRYSD